MLNCKGELLDGSSPLAHAVAQAYQLALDNAVVTKLTGAIIYFDITIQPYAQGYQESLRMAFALAALAVNDLLAEETIQEL